MAPAACAAGALPPRQLAPAGRSGDTMFRRVRRIFLGPKTGSIAPEEPPPPYGEACGGRGAPEGGRRAPSPSPSDHSQIDAIRRAIADLDLLATCKSNPAPAPEAAEEDEVPVREAVRDASAEMGQKTSLLTGRHRSKVSLTWVLRERSDVQYNPCNNPTLTDSSSSRRSPSDTFTKRYQRPNKSFERNGVRKERDYFENDQNAHSKVASDRVIGRNAKQNRSIGIENNQRIIKNSRNLNPNQNHDAWTDYGGGFGSNASSRRHRHRRRKSRTAEKPHQNFGYEIKDIDCFLAEASIENPGNIPVVVTYPSILYQTRNGSQQKELSLSLGMVVNAVFKNQQWLYVQTPHGEEGYVLYASCLPLGILPTHQRSQTPWKAAPCWESTLDLYPQPCGNMTDSEKEQLRGGTKSECGRSRPKQKFYMDSMSAYGERTFDKLYLKATSSCSKLKDICDDSSVPSSVTSKTNDFNLKNKYSIHKKKQKYSNANIGNVRYVSRHTLLVVEKDYEGSKAINTLTVRKGDVVILVQGSGTEADVDSEWFYVRNKDGAEGFIPASIAGHGFL